GSGDVWHAHEEGDQRRAALQRADAAGNRALDAGVHVGVAGNSPVWERPAEQLPEELPCRVRIRGPDLEVNHWVRHLPAPVVSLAMLTTGSTKLWGLISRCWPSARPGGQPG